MEARAASLAAPQDAPLAARDYRRAAATAAVGVLVSAATLLATAAAAGDTATVPAQAAGFPGWLRGVLPPLHLPISSTAVVLVLLAMYLAYVAAVIWADALPVGTLAAAIVAVTALFALGPVLFSRDAFGYIGFARLDVVHGLSPYTHGLRAAAHDPIFRWIGWRRSPTPYGPLFTAASYPLALPGVGVALWAWKLVVVGCALGATALLARTARRSGRSGARAAALFGLNPLTTAFGVGGAHNDLLLVLVLCAGLALAVERRSAGAAATVVATAAMKATALVALPFFAVALRPRRRAVVAALATALAVIALTLVAFGPHVGGMVSAVREEQRLVSTHSLPNVLGRLLGFGGITHGLRLAAAAAATTAILALLVWVARGGDWIAGAGWSFVALLAASAWLMPWYVIWVLPFAALARSPRLTTAALAFGALVIVIRLPLFG